jgi:tripartite-type tricarboxylate transporter receptor subunit TctC
MLRKMLAAAALVAALVPAASQAQSDYPNQPIRFIVPFAAGGGNDVMARVTAEFLNQRTKWQFIVENRPGAASQIGIDYALRQKPDGYTLLWSPSDGLTILPAVKASVPYKVPDDLTFISRMTQLPLLVVAGTQAPFKTFAEFVTYAKANPGKVRYGSSGVGTAPHLLAILVMRAVGVEGTHIPFQGMGPALTAITGNHIDLLFPDPGSAKPFVENKQIIPLAVTSAGRHPSYPDVPTVEQAGGPKTDGTVFYATFAPKGTPEPILQKLRGEMVEVLKDPKYVERIGQMGFQPSPLTGDAFKDVVVKELEQWKGIAKAANIELKD